MESLTLHFCWTKFRQRRQISNEVSEMLSNIYPPKCLMVCLPGFSRMSSLEFPWISHQIFKFQAKFHPNSSNRTFTGMATPTVPLPQETSWNCGWRVRALFKTSLGLGKTISNTQRSIKTDGFQNGHFFQEWPRQTKVLVFLRKKTPEFTKMGEIHELFVLAHSLVWFAGATPDFWMFKARHFGTRLFLYPFGCLFNSTQRGIKTDGFQNDKFSELWKFGVLAPICFGIHLGSLARLGHMRSVSYSPKRYGSVSECLLECPLLGTHSENPSSIAHWRQTFWEPRNGM